MKTYKIIQPVTLTSGVVRLTDEQARMRAHKLEAVKGKKGLYRITGPNQFKAGQEIGYEGDLPKTLATDMEAADADAETKKSTKAQAKADAEAAKAKAEAEKAAAAARAKLEDDALSAWESDEQLREQHAGDFNAYLAAVLEQLG